MDTKIWRRWGGEEGGDELRVSFAQRAITSWTDNVVVRPAETPSNNHRPHRGG